MRARLSLAILFARLIISDGGAALTGATGAPQAAGGPAAAPPNRPPAVVEAPDSPVRLDHVRILNGGGDGPPVLLYAATNKTGDEIDQFTVMTFVFRDGQLKARQVAPGRRTLEARETKYSTMVLDGFAIQPTDLIIVGVNQSQRAGSDMWWRADLQAAAEKAAAEKGALEHKNCDNAMQHNCDNAVDTIWKNHGRLSGSPLMADGLRRGRGDLKKGRWCPRSMAATSDRS